MHSSFVHHRGMTHSLLGGVGLALLGALMLWGIFREHAYWRLALWPWLGVLLHIGMDFLTSYGTQVFWPFTARHYTADAVFIIDYFYTGLMVAVLVVRLNAAGQVQAIEFLNRVFPPPSSGL